ncbi:ABC transporter permease [Bacillus salipaludis]|uniref:ABC transporter permease n=1 Tax=Bacillus salipaludis TaxID=2547811 RepID=A0AA90QYA1_9BACI|nr:ABC transporter permease [Bacillus salipaludis]MDQ6599119.1 ABC transporter permease [Bacillus salipaludis]
MNRLRQQLNALIQPILAIVLGLIVGMAAIQIVHGSIIQTYTEMWNGAFGNFYFVTSTLARATPILLIALGVGFAFRAGVFNLGAEGQLVFGGIAAALTALYLPGPFVVKMIGALLAGIMAGGVWSLLAGWMELKFKVQLVISTLLLNYIATYFASYLVSKPFQDRTGSAALAQTKMLDAHLWLPKLFAGMPLHLGFVFAILFALVLYICFRFTSTGYQISMLGKNPFFASYGGIHKQKIMLLSMFISGALSGLAGTFEIMGTHYRFIDGALTAPSYAWTGLMAALLANSNPIGTIFTSILLAALQTGAMGVERNTDVPLEISSVIQAVIILFISAKFAFKGFKVIKKRRKADGAAV